MNLRCPKCGSTNIFVRDKKRIGIKRGCVAGCLFWPLALLAFTKKSKVVKTCLDCNKEF